MELLNYYELYIDCEKHGRQYNTLCVQCFRDRIKEEIEEYDKNKKWWQFWKWGYHAGYDPKYYE